MIYRIFVLVSICLCFSLSLIAQTGFHLLGNKKKAHIRFDLVNNLPIIKVEINGTPLSFILDTGVNSSILFSLEAADSVRFLDTSPVKLNGLGAGGSIKALKSQGNTIEVGEAVDKNHSIYIIFDSSLNFSPRMGIPIHGILGNDFFQDFVVEINYSKEKITFYDQVFHYLRPHFSCSTKLRNFFKKVIFRSHFIGRFGK